jgi:CRISPR-associated endonuclease Cas2
MLLHYLICYDIQCDKKRLKLAKYLRKIGFRRLQKSVFVGKIKPKKAILLASELFQFINQSIDRLSILPITKDILPKMESFGQDKLTLDWLRAVPQTSNWL